MSLGNIEARIFIINLVAKRSGRPPRSINNEFRIGGRILPEIENAIGRYVKIPVKTWDGMTVGALIREVQTALESDRKYGIG